MHSYTYDRLSAQDNLFLVMESTETPMHIGAVMVLEAGGLLTADGGVDIGRYKRGIEGVLHLIPRYRQKLLSARGASRPVWIDDPHFSLDYHIRHSSLPRPGSLEQLKRLSSRIMSHALDPSRPLWEIWVVEGLESGEQFALISKIHHCMLDGSASADLLSILMSESPDAEIQKPFPYIPRPAPSARELVLDELSRSLKAPVQAAGAWAGLLRRVAREPQEVVNQFKLRAGALGEFARWAVNPCSDSPINGPIGPHRSFDWLTMPLGDVKDVKRVLGCTVNDLVLATVAGAVRRYMLRRRVDPDGLDFRVSAPVDVRGDGDRGKMGNHVSAWVLRVPVGEADVERRLAAVCETTKALKESNAALGAQMMMSAAEWMPASLLSLAANAASGAVNMVVTNVPGPQLPLYLVGAKLLGTYPMVPLLPNCGLGIALFSYDGRLCWGFNADPGLIPDVDALVLAVRDSFEELRGLAVTKAIAPKRRRVSELRATSEPAAAPTQPAPTAEAALRKVSASPAGRAIEASVA